MTAPALPAHPRRSRRSLKLLLIGLFFGTPLLLVILAAAVLVGREKVSRRQLDQRIEAMREQGLPVDDASMTSYHESLTDERDTAAWLAVLDELQEASIAGPIEKLSLAEAWISGETWEAESAARAFLEQHTELVDRVRQLSLRQFDERARPVRFPIQFNSLATPLEDTLRLRSAAGLLSLQGRVDIADGESQAVRTSIESLLGCARVLGGEPILMSQLVALDIDSRALGVLQAALERDRLDEQDLTALLPLLLNTGSMTTQWQLAMHGERGLMLPVFLNPDLASQESRLRMPLPGRSADALHYLNLMAGAAGGNPENADQFLADLLDRDARLQQLVQGGLLERFESLLTGQLSPALRGVGTAFVRQSTLHRLAALCIGVRIMEDRQGELPEELSDLLALQLDPKQLKPPGGQPFGYALDEQGATVWGFDLNQHTCTPSSPPASDAVDPGAPSNQMWVWNLPRADPPAPIEPAEPSPEADDDSR